MSVFCSLWCPKLLNTVLAYSRCSINILREWMIMKVDTKETFLQLRNNPYVPTVQPHVWPTMEVCYPTGHRPPGPCRHCPKLPTASCPKPQLFPWWAEGQRGRFWCSPQGLRLMWFSDYPSLLQRLWNKVVIHLWTSPSFPGRMENRRLTQGAGRNLLSWSHRPQGMVQRLPRTNGDIPGWEQWSPTPQLPFLLWLPSGEALIKFRITMCKAQSEFCLLCHATRLSKHSVRAAVNLLTEGLTGRWPGGPTKFLLTLCYLAWQGETPCFGLFPQNKS